MAFYSGYKCDKCGKAYEWDGFDAVSVSSITHLRSFAKRNGWLVRKEELLCDQCRKAKKTDRRQA